MKEENYFYPSLRSAKRKDICSSGDTSEYAFYNTKANEIFDYLLKGKQIRLLNDHKNPPDEEIKGKMFFK